MKPNLDTKSENTWCPGCPDNMILAATKKTIAEMIESKKAKQIDFAITADIGCHGKLFDYINLSGIYCLHGRALPTAMGMKLGNPSLKVLIFAGDGAMYSEGMGHFVHAFKHNPDMTLILHDNQAFSLTTGQATPTSQQSYVSKSEPLGTFDKPLNPIKIALASNATFIARTSAMDIKHMVEVFTKAINHNGFSFVEVMQDCIVFNLDENNKDPKMYKIKDNKIKQIAEKLADEYDYNSRSGKIPIGIIYQSQERSLEQKWPQLKKRLGKKNNTSKKPNLLKKLIEAQ